MPTLATLRTGIQGRLRGLEAALSSAAALHPVADGEGSASEYSSDSGVESEEEAEPLAGRPATPLHRRKVRGCWGLLPLACGTEVQVVMDTLRQAPNPHHSSRHAHHRESRG